MQPDEIAKCVLETFDSLPAKRKPLQRSDGVEEWVTLSGIVLEIGMTDLLSCVTIDRMPLTCVALGYLSGANFPEVKLTSAIRTGMKCLPKSKVPYAKGTVLHDCHAEIIALRAFNRFLLDECALLAQDSAATSPFVERRDADQINETSPQPFTIKGNVFVHMYCSEAPCGDASMELVMQAQEDATPWELPILPQERSERVSNNSAAEMKGRGFFSELGIVRRKPGRCNPECIRTILTISSAS